MKIKKACKCLGINKKDIYTYTDKQLKHKYHKLALKYHPDKNKLPYAKEKFQEIQDAYDCICKEKQIPTQKIDYRSMLSQYLSYYVKDSDLIVDLLYKKINTNIDNILDKCSRKKLLNIYTILIHNKEVLQIPDQVIEKVMSVICNKTKKIEIQCSFKDIWEQKIYVLTLDKQVLYIPLWHKTLEYDFKDYVLQVKCSCIDTNIHIDKDNSVNIYLSNNNTNKSYYNISALGNKTIPISKFNNNIFTLEGEGIPKVNVDNIYDNSTLGDVIISLV